MQLTRGTLITQNLYTPEHSVPDYTTDQLLGQVITSVEIIVIILPPAHLTFWPVFDPFWALVKTSYESFCKKISNYLVTLALLYLTFLQYFFVCIHIMYIL